MINSKLLSLSFLVSIIFHIFFILNFKLLKEDEEIYVVNLSEFKEFKFAEPVPEPKPIIQDKPEELTPKKIPKPQVKKIIKQDVIPINKIDENKELNKEKEIEREKIFPRKFKKTSKNLQKIEKTTPTKNLEINQFSLQNKKSVKVKKLLSDYLRNISFEINKAAARSYPEQSIRRREQGTIKSVLILDKDGKLINLKFENKSPKRLYNATKKLFKSFSFPKPPQEILDTNGQLQVKIPVNFVLK